MNTPTRRSFITTAFSAVAAFFGFNRSASSKDSSTPKNNDASRMDFNITVRLVNFDGHQFYRMLISSEGDESGKLWLALESGEISEKHAEPDARIELFYNAYAVLCRHYSEKTLSEKWTGPTHPWTNVYFTQNGSVRLLPTILSTKDACR